MTYTVSSGTLNSSIPYHTVKLYSKEPKLLGLSSVGFFNDKGSGFVRFLAKLGLWVGSLLLGSGSFPSLVLIH